MNPASATRAADVLRELDRDRYLATLVLPAEQRDAITALYAFGTEIAGVRERARDPAAGEIRLQWWTDALEGNGHGAVRANPLADALLAAIETYALPVAPLLRLIEARRFDLYQDAMPDVLTFEGYAGDTASALYQLAAMVLNGGRPIEQGDAAGHLGVAHAMIGHLRAFGYNASQGRIFLPWAVLAANDVREADVFAGKATIELTAALEQVGDIAGEHLVKAEAAIRAVPRQLRAVFAPVVVLRRQLWRADLDWPFRRQEDIADWRKIAALTWWRMRNG
ncbi:MAG: phytoene/squalene synthase family protein [Devosia sp.]